MVAVGNSETNLVAMVAVKANSVKPPYDSNNMSHVKYRKIYPLFRFIVLDAVKSSIKKVF